MYVFEFSSWQLRQSSIFHLALLAVVTCTLDTAIGQAYTYDPPTCGATYREEPSKPQQLRVVWEMSAAQECVQQSKFPIACSHYHAALAAAERMPPEAEASAGIKIYLKTMLKTNGCQ